MPNNCFILLSPMRNPQTIRFARGSGLIHNVPAPCADRLVKTSRDWYAGDWTRLTEIARDIGIEIIWQYNGAASDEAGDP